MYKNIHRIQKSRFRHTKMWNNDGTPPFLDLQIFNNIWNVALHNCTECSDLTAENRAREILSSEFVDFSREGESFFNYVWDNFGFDVFRALLRIVKERLPIEVLLNILNNFILRLITLHEQLFNTQNPFVQQFADTQFPQLTYPHVSTTPPNSEMSATGANVYRGRGYWSPFFRNSHSYEGIHRRRSHLDDIYLPNYDDDDLERHRPSYNNRRPYWSRNGPPQRYDHRSVSKRILVDAVHCKTTHRSTSSSGPRSNKSSPDDTAPSSKSSTLANIATNCDRDVNGNSKTELNNEPAASKDVKHDDVTGSKLIVARCHNSEANLKTVNVCTDSHQSNLDKANTVTSEETESQGTLTNELQTFLSSLDRYIESKTNESSTPETGKNECENLFTSATEIESDDEIDGLDDFITIDKIDTAKSYLKPFPILLDRYEVIDMDISPVKRKSNSDDDEERAKKARLDSLYFKMNSDKLLNEINKVLREKEGPPIENYKRFRSKSLSLHKDAEEKSPAVRSKSLDSVHKSEFQVSYDFDLKTSLLLLLKQNSIHNEHFNNILKILQDDEELAADKIGISDDNNTVDNVIATKEVEENDTQAFHPDKTVSETTSRIEKKCEILFLTKTNVSDKENVKKDDANASLNNPNLIRNEHCIQSNIEKVCDFSINSKRKNSEDYDEPLKKIRLDMANGTIIKSDKNTNTEKLFSDNSNSLSSPNELEDFNINNDVESIALCNKSITKDICEESLMDIEEELKSLLAEGNSSTEHKKNKVVPNDTVAIISRNDKPCMNTTLKKDLSNTKSIDTVESIKKINKEQLKNETSNITKSTVCIVKDKTNTNKEPLKKGTSDKTKFTETGKASRSNEKDLTQGTDLQKRREKPSKNRANSNSIQSKSRSELMKKHNDVNKKHNHKNALKTDSSTDMGTPNSHSLSKPIGLEQEPQKQQNISVPKTDSYYERFKKIQSLFGSDSESETEEETKKLEISKPTTNLPQNKTCNAIKSTRSLEKRKFSASTTDPSVPQRIEKRRRETLPGSMSYKNLTGEVKNFNDDEAKRCVINSSLKDPRKEHYRSESSGGGHKPKREIYSANKNTCSKNTDKSKFHRKTEKKILALKSPARKVMNKITKKKPYDKAYENKTRALRESNCKSKREDITAIINSVQSELSKVEKNLCPVKMTVAKEMSPPKVQMEKELSLKYAIQEQTRLKQQQCTALSQDRFPMLRRINSRIQENECNDKAVMLDRVNVSDKFDIIIVKPASTEEDDVIEIKENIPFIDLTEDGWKEGVCQPLRVKSEKSDKTNVQNTTSDMITLYRSEETECSTLDIQVTSETISSDVLKNKENPNKPSGSSKSPGSDNSIVNTSPTSYISPLATESSPAQFTYNIPATINNKNQIQASNSFNTPVLQTVRPLEQHVHSRQQVTRENGGAISNNTKSIQQHKVGQYTPLNNQQSPIPPPYPPTQLQTNLPKSVPSRQNAILYRHLVLPPEKLMSHASPIHTPMSHGDDKGPAALHEIGMQEISRAGAVLLKYLILYVGIKKAQSAYRNELQKMQKIMPAIIRFEISQFDGYGSEREKKLCKDMVEELKSLKLSRRSYNVKSSEFLMERMCTTMQGIAKDVTQYGVFLWMDSLMQPQIVECMAMPFLKDFFSYVSFVAKSIRCAHSARQDPFTPNQRKQLEWQIKKYMYLCSVQRRLAEESECNNNSATPQNTNRPPMYPSQTNRSPQVSNNNPTIHNRINANNLTVHQNIIIRPVGVNSGNTIVPTILNKHSSSHNTGSSTASNLYKIRLPYTVPYEPPASPGTKQVSPVQAQSSPQPNEQTSHQTLINNPQTPSLVVAQPMRETPITSDKTESIDSPTTPISPQETKYTIQYENTVIKEEKELLSSLTELQIETIDLTWIKDIDPKQLESEMELIAVKKEEPANDEEADEEAFATAYSPADSGILSPPIQVEYDESMFTNRSCICEKVAEYVCGCMMAMYCSVQCQFNDWKVHKDVCQKYKQKANKPQQ